MKKYKVSELNDLYREFESCDKSTFSEMRTNLLLVYGDQYTKLQNNLVTRARGFAELNEQQKLRLTKNHVQNITKRYAEHITSTSPGVSFSPKNKNEIQDQKSAELHQAVWADGKDKFDFEEKVDEWGDDFAGIGEVACKIFYDPNAGDIVAYEAEVDDNGETVMDEEDPTQPKRGIPKYSGGFVFEPVYGFNLLRSPNCQDLKKSPILCLRKMVDKKLTRDKYPEHKDKLDSGNNKTLLVFDGTKGGYRKTEEEVMVKEFYFRPCPDYPQGYFYYVCGDAILEEGELPGGIFPIVWQYFDKTQTSPRGYSPIRTMRPYQIEINRAASKIAEHQVTLGDDKLLIQNGSSISSGIALPGIRSINYAGAPPTILQGRDGSHYLNYMVSQIEELYKTLGVPDEDEAAQQDPYTMLFRSAKQKKKFKRYIRRFERFIRNVAKVYMSLAKIYLSDEAVIKAVGRNEAINIPEFKNADDISYSIIVESQSDDIETKFGTQIFINQVLQYVGGKLDKKDIGKLLKTAPYGNAQEAFSDFTMDYDSATNMILSLDRGNWPIISEFDDPIYMGQRLVNRMRQADFTLLDGNSQDKYRKALEVYKEMDVNNAIRIQRLQQGFIPTDGYMVKCDFYVSDAQNPGKTHRASIPYSAIAWLMKQLESQGFVMQAIDSMNPGLVGQISDSMGAQGASGQPQLPAPEQRSGGQSQPPVPNMMA